jgi:adenine phosphoribosyltransferase
VTWIPNHPWIDYPRRGIAYRDPAQAFADPAILRRLIEAFRDSLAGDIDAVAGIDLGGAALAGGLATLIGRGAIEVRKSGSTRPEVIRGLSQNYELGDGIFTPRKAVRPGMRLVLLDDCLMSGGTAIAAVRLLRKCGATVTQAMFVFELDGLDGRKRLEQEDVEVFVIEKIPAANPAAVEA